MKEVWEVAKVKVRPMSWPERSLKVLEGVDEKHIAYLWCQMVLGYRDLDLGMVESALERLLKVARSPEGGGRYIGCSGEVGFLLAAYYGEREAGKRWIERFMDRAERCSIAEYWRWTWSVDRSAESKAAFLRAAEASGEVCVTEWVTMAEKGEWEEELDPGMPSYLKARILEPPGG